MKHLTTASPAVNMTASGPSEHSDCGRALKALVADAHASARRIAELLDGLSHASRVSALDSLSRADQRLLYDKMQGFHALHLKDLVPARTAALSPVAHHGRNSLPTFRSFEKRFYRYGHAQREVAGANFQLLSPLTGPGYFVCHDDPASNEVLIDYTALPTTAPSGWCALTPNTRLPSSLVYGGTIDRLRYVSRHVSIGSVTRNGRSIGAWFTLCKREAL